MKTFFPLLVVLALTCPRHCRARGVRVVDMKTLIAGSKLVLAGKVKSVEPSGLTTKLTYPTWKGTTFEWLKVAIEVVEPIKGAKKGKLVRTLMLCARGRGVLINGPGMVRPEKGQFHLLCLLPTTFEDVYASMTAPWDDNQAIFILDRTYWKYRNFKQHPEHFDKFPKERERYRTIFSLVDDQGRITANGATELRKKYKAEIATAPPKNAVIHLKWKTQTSPSGWQWNVPDDQDLKAKSKKQASKPVGPVTKP